MIATQYINLNMVPSGYPPVVYMSQYDVGRPIGFVVSASGSTSDLDDYTVTIEGTRSDGTPITAPVTTDGNICALETTATMTNKADRYPAQIVVADGDGKRIASIPVTMMVVKAAMDENAEGVEEDRSLYQQYTGTVRSLIADIRTQLNAETAARQAAVSAEASVRQAADNTLQSNINAEASTRATQDASLQSQINQLVAPEGEAPSAAEVENARVGADGTVYPTLGDAIRGQVTDVKSAIDVAYDETGVIKYASDANNTATYRTITFSRKGMRLAVNGTVDAGIRIRISGDAIATITSSTWQGWSKTVTLLADHIYRLRKRVLAGSVSNGGYAVRIFDTSNTDIAHVSTSEDETTFKAVGGDVMLVFITGSTTAFDNFEIETVLTDITEAVATDTAIEQNADAIEKIQASIDGTPIVSNIALTSGGRYISSQNPVGGAPVRESATGKYAVIDVSAAKNGGTVKLSMDALTANSTVATLFTDENDVIITKIATSNWMQLNQDTGKYECTTNPIYNIKKIYFSVYGGSSTITMTIIPAKVGQTVKTLYVSVDGSDDNGGTSSTDALATVNRALELGAENVLLGGGKYFQSIDLSLAKGSAVRISPAVKDALPVFYAPTSLISDSETAVEGYTKVHSCPCDKTFDTKNIWIFQEGVADTTTEITTADRHPLQRGKAYRCEDTKIAVCSATTLADALTEIENATTYKWFMDTANSTLYFSRPSEVTTQNPIMGSFGGSLFTLQNRGIALEMTGIGAKYEKVDLRGLVAPVLTDCFCGNICSAAAFQWDGCAGAKLYRCEAFRVFYTANNGDGFNAHSDNTGDAFAKQTTSMLFDCWGHDCCDDGYSDHERCEISIFGGLFECNGAGVTPAIGSHCTCYNVLSRYNGEADFFYTGNPSSAEGGVGGQIACYGCVAKGRGASTSRGFRLNGSNVQALFVNCVAIDHGTGFFSESNGGTQVGTLINCNTINCNTQKSAIFTAQNGTPVT